MKKIVVFVTIIINLFAVNGSVGIISGVQEETYIDHNKYFIFPSWSLKYRYFSINGMNISKIEFKLLKTTLPSLLNIPNTAIARNIV